MADYIKNHDEIVSFVDECINASGNPEELYPYKEYIIDALLLHVEENSGYIDKEDYTQQQWQNHIKKTDKFHLGSRPIAVSDIRLACIRLILTGTGDGAIAFFSGNSLTKVLTTFATIFAIFAELINIYQSAPDLKGNMLCVYLYAIQVYVSKYGKDAFFSADDLLGCIPSYSSDCEVFKSGYILSCETRHTPCKIKNMEILNDTLKNLAEEKVIDSFKSGENTKYSLRL